MRQPLQQPMLPELVTVEKERADSGMVTWMERAYTTEGLVCIGYVCVRAFVWSSLFTRM